MMSRTDKTRPYRISNDDPHNRRFMVVQSDMRWGPSFWKKLDTCSSSNCCYGYKLKRVHREKRTAWKSIRHNWMATRREDMIDLEL